MKKVITFLVSALALTLPPALLAADQKLEGEALCAKCQLKQSDKCRTAIQVTANGKKETYLTDVNDPKAKELHAEICQGGKPTTVEGQVSEKDGQKLLKITKFELKK